MQDNREAAPQHILVFQQRGSGENKIRGIREYGGERFLLETFAIDTPLPALVDESSAYLPENLHAGVVLDYLTHPDLAHDLHRLCEQQGIPVVASAKKSSAAWAITPRVCCALPRLDTLGAYGECFGLPEFSVHMDKDRIAAVRVLRGAPCGATWQAAAQLSGLQAQEALERIGILVQFACKAGTATWNVLHGKNPVHLAAQLHQAAFARALTQSAGTGDGFNP